ncbi:MAG: LysR family transcriptional regulator, partial [Rhodospirillaceae bacterium]|nr:LysR family transcriptional regulator [Rhodospirillaceae bacterium]
MHKYVKQGVPSSEHPSVMPVDRLDWNAIRIFVVVWRHGSFRGASNELGMALNTVRRHIETLEHELGCLLMIRNAKGISLTEDGEGLLGAAKQMEQASFGIRQALNSERSALEGRVRISVTEGFGTYWVMPKMVEFQREHPNIIAEVNCTMRISDLLDADADIAIQLVRPESPNLKVVKLGRMHVMPFASKEYLETHGCPNTFEDVVNHTIVEQLSPQLDVDAVDRLFPNIPREGFVSVTTNTSSAHYQAVLAGAGLGMLPTYMAMFDTSLKPVDLGLHV